MLFLHWRIHCVQYTNMCSLFFDYLKRWHWYLTCISKTQEVDHVRGFVSPLSVIRVNQIWLIVSYVLSFYSQRNQDFIKIFLFWLFFLIKNRFSLDLHTCTIKRERRKVKITEQTKQIKFPMFCLLLTFCLLVTHLLHSPTLY